MPTPGIRSSRRGTIRGPSDRRWPAPAARRGETGPAGQVFADGALYVAVGSFIPSPPAAPPLPHENRVLRIDARTGAVVGLNGAPVEVDIGPGLPAFNVVGLPDAAIQRGARARAGRAQAWRPGVPEQGSLPLLWRAAWREGVSATWTRRPTCQRSSRDRA